MIKDPIPHIATHPGVLIKNEIDATEDLNQKTLASLLDIKPSYLNEVIKGKRAISPKLALLLEEVFAIKADYWLRLQAQYDLDILRIEEKNQTIKQKIQSWKDANLK